MENLHNSGLERGPVAEQDLPRVGDSLKKDNSLDILEAPEAAEQAIESGEPSIATRPEAGRARVCYKVGTAAECWSKQPRVTTCVLLPWSGWKSSMRMVRRLCTDSEEPVMTTCLSRTDDRL